MRTRTGVVVAAAVLAAAVLGSTDARGTSYDPFTPTADETAAPREAAAGETVVLFHSGADHLRQPLRVGDVLDVSRVGADAIRRPVGKVRVAAPLGAVCLRGEVLEGRVRSHDLGEIGGVHCLVIPESVCPR